MMKYKVILVLMFLVLQSCCFHEGDLLGTYPLSNEERNLIPYEVDQVISMKHSGGHEFHLEVFVDHEFYSDQEACEDYYVYEHLSATLISKIPLLQIELVLQNVHVDFDFPVSVGLEINGIYFYFDEQLPLETVTINNMVYSNVRRYFTEQPDSNIVEVLYNDEFGILQINYSNGDYVEIY